MNFFAKRPKTPAELVRAVRDLVAPSGRLGIDFTGGFEGRKKVRPPLPSCSPALRRECYLVPQRRRAQRCWEAAGVGRWSARGQAHLGKPLTPCLFRPSIGLMVLQANEELSRLLSQLKYLLYGDAGTYSFALPL